MTELEVISGKIRKLMNEIADDVATGAAKDWAEYRHLVGQIAGLAMVEREILDLNDLKDDEEEA